MVKWWLHMDLVTIIVLQKRKQINRRGILSSIRDQRIKSRETMEQLKSCETREVLYTYLQIYWWTLIYID